MRFPVRQPKTKQTVPKADNPLWGFGKKDLPEDFKSPFRNEKQTNTSTALTEKLLRKTVVPRFTWWCQYQGSEGKGMLFVSGDAENLVLITENY